MKKAQSNIGIWIGLGVFILFIIGAITVFIILMQDSDPEETEGMGIPLKLYLRAVNYLDETESIEANYRIETNHSLISEGVLSGGSVTELEVPRKQLALICWADGYYLGRTYKFFSGEELAANVSSSVCNMKKIGSIDVKHTGELSEGTSIIRLNITATGNYGKLKICNRWSAGIISALPRNNQLICDKGVWLNWSKQDPETKEKTMLPDTYFRCGQCTYPYCDWTARCSSVNGANCEEYSMKIPNRYLGRVDNCYYSGRSLTDESVIIEYLVRSSSINPMDEVEFFIMDSDRRHDPIENNLIYMTEQNGEVIGAEDSKYIISYNG